MTTKPSKALRQSLTLVQDLEKKFFDEFNGIWDFEYRHCVGELIKNYTDNIFAEGVEHAANSVNKGNGEDHAQDDEPIAVVAIEQPDALDTPFDPPPRRAKAKKAKGRMGRIGPETKILRG